MNSLQRFALVASLAFALAANHAMAAEDAKSSKNFLQDWAKAWQTSDVDKMMAFYDTAKETMAVESLGHLRQGPAEIRKMYRGAFDDLIFDRFTLTPITQGQHGRVAWATYRCKAEMRLKSDNTKYVLEVHGSFVMKKEKETWKITLEHFSTIPNIPRVRVVEE